jgi:RimJ/RimL family protein N-acetyltransferase
LTATYPSFSSINWIQIAAFTAKDPADHIDFQTHWDRIRADENISSIRVLEKCGFSIIGEDKGFANACGEEVEKFIFKLEGKKDNGFTEVFNYQMPRHF